jgi:hypothetical protein
MEDETMDEELENELNDNIIVSFLFLSPVIIHGIYIL